MDDYFLGDEQYETAPVVNVSQNNTFQQQQHQQENVWDYAQVENTHANLETTHTIDSQNYSNSSQRVQIISSQNIQVDDELTRKIRQEQEKIQLMLREKANKEYEQKQAKKEAGKVQIERFFEKKDKQKEQRKQRNQAHQKEIIHKAKQLNQTPGWKKVAENVNLKLGQHKGSKPVNRMREALINKRQDQKNGL